jgi:hypothetical protein
MFNYILLLISSLDESPGLLHIGPPLLSTLDYKSITPNGEFLSLELSNLAKIMLEIPPQVRACSVIDITCVLKCIGWD